MIRLLPKLSAALYILYVFMDYTLIRGEPPINGPGDQCADFVNGRHPSLPWTYEDCIQVWTDFSGSVKEKHQPRLPDAAGWTDVAAELRRAGSPCLVWKKPTLDGVGSTSVRSFGAWIFARQLGCDWITPEWTGRSGGIGTELCHSLYYTKPREAHPTLTARSEETRPAISCSKVDWVSYFQFDVPSVSWPMDGRINTVEVRFFFPAESPLVIA